MNDSLINNANKASQNPTDPYRLTFMNGLNKRRLKGTGLPKEPSEEFKHETFKRKISEIRIGN